MRSVHRRKSRTPVPLRVWRLVKKTAPLRAWVTMISLLSLVSIFAFLQPLVRPVSQIAAVLVSVSLFCPLYFFWMRRFGKAPDGFWYWWLPRGSAARKDMLRLGDWLNAPIDFEHDTTHDANSVRYVIRPVRARADSPSQSGHPEPDDDDIWPFVLLSDCPTTTSVTRTPI
jgi:hypothetical protein